MTSEMATTKSATGLERSGPSGFRVGTRFSNRTVSMATTRVAEPDRGDADQWQCSLAASHSAGPDGLAPLQTPPIGSKGRSRAPTGDQSAQRSNQGPSLFVADGQTPRFAPPDPARAAPVTARRCQFTSGQRLSESSAHLVRLLRCGVCQFNIVVTSVLLSPKIVKSVVSSCPLTTSSRFPPKRNCCVNQFDCFPVNFGECLIFHELAAAPMSAVAPSVL